MKKRFIFHFLVIGDLFWCCHQEAGKAIQKLMSFENEQFDALAGAQLILLGITLPSQTKLMSNTEL